MQPVAALPMYDWPECRAETDAEWAEIRDRLVSEGIDAPKQLTRRNGDLPPVPGGIRDASGSVIAPDPATLPPDELDLAMLWRHPGLIFAQTCWGPMEKTGLAEHVTVIGQPDYSQFAGGEGEAYRSAIIMRRAEAGVRLPVLMENLAADAGRPEKSAARTEFVSFLGGRRFAFNGPDSMSGVIALSRDLAAAGVIKGEAELPGFWSETIQSGGHRQSVVAVAEGRADVAAIDCRTFHLCQRFEPASDDVAIIGWTAPRLGLPFIRARKRA